MAARTRGTTLKGSTQARGRSVRSFLDFGSSDVTDQTHGLRQVIIACRKGGQTHVQKYMPDLQNEVTKVVLKPGGVVHH